MGFFAAVRSMMAKPTSALLTQTRNVAHMGDLAPFEGAVKSYKRLGRGQASGLGKTSGRGQKGQKARNSVPRWFEGGQTPFYKRFPIVGFKRPHKKEYFRLNLTRIQSFWERGAIPLKEGETLTIRAMKECGLITGSVKDGVVLLALGKTNYNVPLNIEVSRASQPAIEAVEKAGNTLTTVYFTKLGLRAHLHPEQFLLKTGHVPLQARPTHQRDIKYYSNPEKRGYLLKKPLLLLDHIQQAQTQKVRKEHVVQLDRELQTASNKRFNEFDQTRVVDVSSLV